MFGSYHLKQSAPLIGNLGKLFILIFGTQWYYPQWCSEMLYFLIFKPLQLLSFFFLEFRNYWAEYLQISQNILFSDLNPAYQVPAWGKDQKKKLALILQNWLNKSCAAGLCEMCPVTASGSEDSEG